jgi:hypothetical protein
VVLRDVETTRLDQAGRGELLAEYLAAPAPETVFVVTTGDEAGRRRWQATCRRPQPAQGRGFAGAVRAEPARLHDRARGRLGADRLAGEDQRFNSWRSCGWQSATAARSTRGRAPPGSSPRGLRHRRRVSRRDWPEPAPAWQVTIKDDIPRLLGMLGKAAGALVLAGARAVPKESRSAGQIDKRGPTPGATRAERSKGCRELALLDDRVKRARRSHRGAAVALLLGFLPSR